MAEPFLSLERVANSYGEIAAVAGIDLAVERGEFVVLLGPSGSGKTTVLSILGGFVEPSAGRVLLDGEDVTHLPPARRPTATVFQDYALFPHMSVGGNVAFGLRMQGVATAERLAKARDMLRIVGLDHAFDKKPHQLSGGQRQRVALARALVVQPAVLLLDEPLGALDLKLRRQMQDELKAIQKRVGTAFVHVTHDQEEAMALADHIVVMNQGRIEDEGAPERVYARPATRFAATFMGESTIVPGEIDDEGRIATPFGLFQAPSLKPGDAAWIAIRPEHVQIGPGIPAIVKDVVYQGSFKRVTATPVSAPDIRLLARLPAGAAVQEGTEISLRFDPGEIIVLKD